jgi:exodeoxyribonuclease V gamma subunit
MDLRSSNRLETLADALAEALGVPLSSPFVKETVLVPSRAMGAWLSLEIANRHGVFANTDFVAPRAWIDRLTLGPEATDPFHPTLLTWSIAASLPAHLAEPPFAALRTYLENDDDGTKRLALSARIARTLDTYVLYRPELVAGWEQGRDDHWQARLFRTLVHKHGSVHAASRARALVAQIGRRTDLPERLSLFEVGPQPPTIQRAIRALGDRIRVCRYVLEDAASEPRTPAALSVHACHSPMRECEVLRDQLLAALQEDRTLEPRDILVLCPDLETYAPLIAAVFGVAAEDPQYLPFRIVDRPSGATLPIFEATLALLRVVGSRMTAPEVIDLLALAPIRSKFGLSEGDLEPVRVWVDESGIRWAADAEHRREVGQPWLTGNTWRFGLDRLLVGYAMGADGDTLFQGTLPFDDVEGSSAAPLGGLAAFCETLFALRHELAQPSTLPVWRDRIASAVSRMVSAHPSTEFQHQLVREALAALVERAEVATFTEALPLAAVRDALEEELTEQGARFSLSAGAVRFASLAAGRAVPARVVALLGMSDGSFPRRPRPMGFDLMALDPAPGDPSVREEDRRVFDAALLSARERLLVTYVGKSIRNDAERPPSVVVSELLDKRDVAVVYHALHAFSPRYFRDPDGPLFSHAAALCDAARAMQGARAEAPAFVRAAVPEPPPDERERVAIDDLCDFFSNPAKAFVSKRVGVYLGSDVEPLADREPFTLDGFEKFAVQSELVERVRRGGRVSHIPPAIAASGRMPLGTVGEVVYEDLHEQPAEMGREVAKLLGAKAPAPVDVDVPLGDGVRLIGCLRNVSAKGQVLYRFAKPRGKHLMDAWIRHLALHAVGVTVETTLFARGDRELMRYRFAAAAEPREILSGLVALYRLGRRVPIPFFPNASEAFAETLLAGKPRDVAMAAAHKSLYEGYDGPDEDRYFAKVYGERDPLAPTFRLVSGPALAVPSFEELAMRVFGPLLEHKEDVE